MKKLLTLFLALIATTALWAGRIITYTATNQLSRSTLDKGATTFGPAITSHTFFNGTGTITCSGEITTIGYRAFASFSDLISITIPNSVTTIGELAFYGCSGLTSVTIPNSVTTIGNGAFENCTSLVSIQIPNSVTTIGMNAFYNCSSLPIIDNLRYADTYLVEAVDETLSTYTIKEGTTWIGYRAFANCDKLTSIFIPNSVTTIGEYAFSGCSGLTSVTIPNSVTTIGEMAFFNCSGLTSVTTPNSVTTIGNSAFYNCSGLTSITIGNSVTTIGENAFYGCSNLKTVYNDSELSIIKGSSSYGYVAYYADKVYNGILVGDFIIKNDTILNGYIGTKTDITLPNSVTTIGDDAFQYCSGLTSVTIPNSVTMIGNSAFYNCSGLTSVTIPNSVTTIGDYAFKDCSGLQSVIFAEGSQLQTIGDYAFTWCSNLTSVTIPNSVTTIGEKAFYFCMDLAIVTIGNSVISIGEKAFYECTSLKTVINNSKLNIERGSTNYGYVAFYASKVYKNGQICGNLVVQDGTIVIGYVGHPTNIIIPDGIKQIGKTAFNGYSGLTSIVIPNSVTTIGNGAFEKCSGLTSVTLNSNVICSNEYTLSNNIGNIFGPQVKKYIIGDSVTTIGNYAFSGCSGLTSVTIPNSVTTIEESAFYYCSSLTSVTIGNSVTTIGNYAFSGCSGLTSVTIPNSVTTIEEAAFAYCSGLTSVTIPNSVTTIGNFAFYWCRSLTSVTIPNSVTTIGDCAFRNCSGLISITVASNNPKYDSRGNCNAIIKTATNELIQGCQNTTIPNTVTTIGDQAFSSCSGLTSVTIPYSVTTIGKYAFSGCDSLTTIISYAIIPPTCGENCFSIVNKDIPVYVPARSVDDYKQAEGWKDFVHIQGNPYDYAMVSCSTENGTISGAGKYIKGDTCTLTATADYGYHFTQWNDGNTDNPRKIIVTQDTTFTAEFAKNIYIISVEAEHGSVTGGGDYEYLSNVQLTATADEHYHFVQWSDEVTDNPRQITVESDKTYTAIFSIDQHTISAFAEHGVVSGTGTYDYGTEATLSVIPDFGYEFATWSDENTDNPRTILVTEDATYYSTCTLSNKGACGDNLYWEYKDGALIINGQGTMYNFAFNQVPWILYRDSIQRVELCEGLTNVGNNAFASCSKLTTINIPNSVTTIAESAFEDCTYLKTITLGKSLTDIGCNAFKGDFRIEEITSYAEVTPNVCSSTFDGLSKQYIYLYVPENSIRGYQVDPNWNGFDIRTKAADKKPIDGDNPIVTPSDQDVTITWPITDGTDTYTITITKNGETVCVLTFNAQGQLVNIAFKAPAADGAHQAPAATLTAQGYQFTVTGLNPGTAYNYSVTATDAGGKTLAEHKGNFSTTGGTGLESVHDARCTMHKVLRNGQLLIETNNATYTPMGQKVR